MIVAVRSFSPTKENDRCGSSRVRSSLFSFLTGNDLGILITLELAVANQQPGEQKKRISASLCTPRDTSTVLHSKSANQYLPLS
jgi:hypothetical protein